MKVTHVAVCPSEAAKKAGRPALTPELLAASGARYSRNNEGLESILSKIDPNDLEKSVDSIFRMVDYGHQSIADMVPVAMFIDGISLWLAHYVWTLCPTAGGQESSTRYLKISLDGLIPPEELGIPSPQISDWRDLMESAFQSYQASLKIWEELSWEQPTLMGIPRALLEDGSDLAKRKVARMRRNYAFDRARYFLPVAAATNVMLIMSARAWVQLCQHLLSHPLPEPRRLGEAIRRELEIPAPRMIRHAQPTDSHRALIAHEFEKVVQLAAGGGAGEENPPVSARDESTRPFLEITLPPHVSVEELIREIVQDLSFHPNRYAPVGSALQRTAVRFGWPAISFGEVRDLNRHRTGTKYCPQVPKGFYFAIDQIPSDSKGAEDRRNTLRRLASCGLATSEKIAELLRARESSSVYWALLGTEYPFEHLTTADKFLYEAELRTGLGAHFRYAKHLRDVLALWYERFPATKPLILEGSAEPE